MTVLAVVVFAVISVVDTVLNRRLAYWQKRLIEEQRALIVTQADTIIVLEAHVALLQDERS